MKKIILLLVTYLNVNANSNKIIKNINVPSCKNCIHYKPSYLNTDFTSPLNKCTMFGDKNIINDQITFNYADSCRNDENKCGYNGKYFEENNFLIIKIITHQLISNLPNIILISLITTAFIGNILISKKL
jgi:hypothetical protein